MVNLIGNGTIFEWIAVLMMIEAFALLVWLKLKMPHIDAIAILLNLSAGLGLLVSTIGVFRQWSWPLVAVFLCVSLICHMLDLWKRWGASIKRSYQCEHKRLEPIASTNGV
jgi:hypothetical protein